MSSSEAAIYAAERERKAQILKITDICIAHIRKYEGFSADPYNEALPGEDPRWYYGYGHRIYNYDPNKHVSITLDDANYLMRTDFNNCLQAVPEHYDIELNEYQRHAIALFIYNVGANKWIRKSTMHQMLTGIKPYDERKFKDFWMLWNKTNGKVNDRLTERRAFEVGLYFRKP